VEQMNLKDVIGGWFIGNFNPSVLKTDQFEIGYKKYKAGDKEQKHVHKIATEYTVVIKGTIEMKGIQYREGDIVIINHNEAVEFKAITDVENIVVKVPCALNDKYIVE
jgi:quercetin dioxygenase-like cupin family protein